MPEWRLPTLIQALASDSHLDRTPEKTGMRNNENKIKLKRPNNRWLMVFYDTLLFAVCWLVVLAVFQQIEPCTLIYMGIGYVLFMAMRFLFGVYKMILRYGTVAVFGRLLLADAISGALLCLANLLVRNAVKDVHISFLTLACSVAAFVLISIVVRVLYCYLYRFAMKRNALAKAVRYLLERFAFVDFDSSASGATLHYVLESRETSPVYINELQWIVDKFAIRGQVTSITRLNAGYINRTYRVETISETGHTHKYTLQRINTNVFKDVDLLMDNYKLVTDTLFGKLRLGDHQEREAVQTLRPTKDGCSYLQDKTGCWRMMTYFDDVYSLDLPNSPKTFEDAGFAFGSFIRAVEHLDIHTIKEVIPNFHNTKSRYEDLERSIDLHKDGRVKDVMPEISFIRARAEKYGMISDALEKGWIPKRICHNDCNLNNILFDKKTNKPVAIIDLDTVMPSSPLYDFGDSMRIGTNTAKDDEKDLSKVSCDLDMFEHYARGYLRACGDMLTQKELELLPYASLIITSEDGIRFLMDHIDGDTYYTISYPGQNLDRARTQLKLVEDMERKLPQIKRILREIYAELGLKAKI